MSDILRRIVEFANRVIEIVDEYSQRLPRVLAVLLKLLVYLALVLSTVVSILIYGVFVTLRILWETWTVPKPDAPRRRYSIIGTSAPSPSNRVEHKTRRKDLYDIHINSDFFAIPRVSEDFYALPKSKKVVKVRGWDVGTKEKIW